MPDPELPDAAVPPRGAPDEPAAPAVSAPSAPAPAGEAVDQARAPEPVTGVAVPAGARPPAVELAGGQAAEAAALAPRAVSSDRGLPSSEVDAGPSIPEGVKTAAGWAWRVLVLAAFVIGFGWVCQFFSQVTVPLAIAVLLTALLVPVATRLKRLGWPPAAAAAVSLLGMVLLILGVGYAIGLTAAAQAPALVDETKLGFQQLLTWLAGDPWHIDQAQIDTWLASVTTWLNESRALLASYAAKVGTQVGHFLAGVAIALIATFFFLYEGEHLWHSSVRLLPGRYHDRTFAAAERGWASLVAYMRAQVLVTLVDAAGVSLAALLLGLPMVPALFALTFFVCFIPVVGAVIAGTVATLLALVTHGWVAALIMAGATVVVMWTESHFLQPLLLGRAASLHPLAVLVGLVIGAEVAGIVGALLVIPTMAFGVAFIRALRGMPVADAPRSKH